jgi:putative zinc finger protein
VTDDTPLVEKGRSRWESGDHPAPEKLAAYQAGELPPEEDDAIQEHVANCEICAEVLLDLQRFLDLAPAEQPQQGVADFETAVEWRELRKRIRGDVERERFFASARGGYSVAAALLAIGVGLAAWNVTLLRESREPQPVSTLRTLEAKESFRGGASGEEVVSLPAQITLNLPTDAPDPLYRVELIPHGSGGAEEVLEMPPQGSELSFFVPEKALRPGKYTLRVQGLRQGHPFGATWIYELMIGASGR